MVDLSQMGGSMQWLLQPTSLHSLSQQFLALSDVVGQLQALEGAMMRALADFYVCVVGVLSPLQRAKAMAHMWPRYPDFVRGVRLLSEGRTAAGKGLPAA